jgi:hypothetical protein
MDRLRGLGAWGLPSLTTPETWGKSRMRMREQTQFVAFLENVSDSRPKFLNNFRIHLQGTKNADKKDSHLGGVNF